MERSFKIASPCIPGEHYMLPTLDSLSAIRRPVDRGQYFVLHSPKQSGKTTALKALIREVNAKGSSCALYCPLETMQNGYDPESSRWPSVRASSTSASNTAAAAMPSRSRPRRVRWKNHSCGRTMNKHSPFPNGDRFASLCLNPARKTLSFGPFAVSFS